MAMCSSDGVFDGTHGSTRYNTHGSTHNGTHGSTRDDAHGSTHTGDDSKTTTHRCDVCRNTSSAAKSVNCSLGDAEQQQPPPDQPVCQLLKEHETLNSAKTTQSHQRDRLCASVVASGSLRTSKVASDTRVFAFDTRPC